MQFRRASKGKTYPTIDSPVNGEHDGENFSSVPQSDEHSDSVMIFVYSSFNAFYVYRMAPNTMFKVS